MSHTVQVKTQIRDVIAMRSACQRIGLSGPVEGTFMLFTSKVSGLAVQLPGWRYRIVCNVATGEMCFDNYNGRWGDQRELDRLLQAYAVEKAKIEARKKGHTVSEQTLADGSIKLTISVGA